MIPRFPGDPLELPQGPLEIPFWDNCPRPANELLNKYRIWLNWMGSKMQVTYGSSSLLCKSACVFQNIVLTHWPPVKVSFYSSIGQTVNSLFRYCILTGAHDAARAGAQKEQDRRRTTESTTRCHSHYLDFTADWAMLVAGLDASSKILEENTAMTEQHSHDHNEYQHLAALKKSHAVCLLTSWNMQRHKKYCEIQMYMVVIGNVHIHLAYF